MNSSLLIIYGGGASVTIGIFLAVLFGIRHPAPRTWSRLAALLLLITVPFLLMGQILKVLSLHDYLDFAVWLEVFSNISKGASAISTIQEATFPGKLHWYSSHFTPLVYVFGWAFRLSRTPYFLLFLQWLALTSTVVAVFLYAQSQFKNRTLALMLAAVFALHPTFQYVSLYEFEGLRFCMPLLLLCFYCMERRNIPAYWIFFILSLLVREEVSLTLFCLGLYILVFLPGVRKHGLLTMAVSLAYFYVAVKFIIPSYSTSSESEHVASAFFPILGHSPSEALHNLLSNPEALLLPVLDPYKMANIFMFLLPVSFLCFFAPEVLLIGTANVGINLLSTSITHTSYFLYYLSPFVPFLFIATVKGIERLARRLEKIERFTEARMRLGAACLAGALSASIFFGPAPFSFSFWFQGYKLAPFRTQNFHYSTYVFGGRELKIRELAELVPKEAEISAEQHLMPLFFDRKSLRAFPDIRDVNYVIIDKNRYEKSGISTVPDSWDGLRQNPQKYYDLVEAAPAEWEQVVSYEGFMIFRRKTR
jgi:uncharacterized membrane protein